MDICNFYVDILKELYKVSGLKYPKIRQSLINIRSYKNPEIEEHDIVSFDEDSDRLAYIFAYGVIHLDIMNNNFSRMLKSNPSMLNKITSMKTIKLCILGGGPAFEAVSICKILSDTLVNYKDTKRSPLEIYITVVDMFEGWKKDAELIITSAEKDLCDSNNIQIHFSFIEADLTTDFTKEVSKTIKNSHIVTMFKFLSDISDSSYYKKEIRAVVQKIIDSMSFKACLFFLDTSGGGTFKNIDSLIDGLPYTSRIYGPCCHVNHFLNVDYIERISCALERMFRSLECTSKTKVSCSAWIKVHNIIEVNELHCDTVNNTVPIENSGKFKEKAPKIKIKRVVQSPVQLKELMTE